MRVDGFVRALGLLLAAPAVAAATLLLPTGPASAVCAAPEVTVAPATAAPGSEVDVAGRYFVDGCNDTGDVPDPPASTGIRVVVDQAGESWRLATVDANDDDEHTVWVRVRLPEALAPGPATLRVERAVPVPLTVTAGPPTRLPEPPGDGADDGPWAALTTGAVGLPVPVAAGVGWIRGRRRA